MRKKTVLVGITLLFSGCFRPPFAGDPAGPGPRPGWKIVSQKVEPSYLIAVDGSECFVSAERFEEVERGDRILCAWSDRGPSRRAGIPVPAERSPGVGGVPGPPVIP